MRGNPSLYRVAAACLVHSLRGGATFSQAAIDNSYHLGRISPQARALAVDIAEYVQRHLSEIEAELAKFCTLPGHMAADIMIAALAEFMMGDAPSYAVVSHAVETARAFGGDRNAGFVNAVLRRALDARVGADKGCAA